MFLVDERQHFEKILQIVGYVVTVDRFESRFVFEIRLGDSGVELLDKEIVVEVDYLEENIEKVVYRIYAGNGLRIKGGKKSLRINANARLVC